MLGREMILRNSNRFIRIQSGPNFIIISISLILKGRTRNLFNCKVYNSSYYYHVPKNNIAHDPLPLPCVHCKELQAKQ